MDQDIGKILITCAFTFPLVLIPGVLHSIYEKKVKKMTFPSSQPEGVQKEGIPGNSLEVREIWIKKESSTSSFIAQVIFLLIGGVFYYFIANIDFDTLSTVNQTLIAGSVVFAYIILIASIAWWKVRNEMFTRMWRREMLTSVIIGLLAGLILRGWLSASIKSIEYLFGLDFNSNIYEHIGIICVLLVGGTIMLTNFINQKWDEIPVYNRIMRIFGQYIFLPLTIIYWIILLSYGVKILLTGVWPEGIIIYMVLWYVAFGILTWLTTYPAEASRGMTRAHFALFTSFIFASLLMIPALEMRIEQYGWTINRYFIGAIIVWIILSSTFSLIFRRRRFFIWSSILVLLGALSLYGGKRSAPEFAITQQKNSLMTLLQEKNIQTPLTSWSLKNLSDEEMGKVTTPLFYLLKTTDLQNMEGIFSASDIAKLETENGYRYDRRWLVCKMLEIDICSYNYYPMQNNGEKVAYFTFYTDSDTIDISWYNMLYNVSNKGWDNNIVQFGEHRFDISPYLEEIYNNANKNEYYYGPTKPADTNQETKNWFVIVNGDIKIIIQNLQGKRIEDKEGNIKYQAEYWNGFVVTKWDGQGTESNMTGDVTEEATFTGEVAITGELLTDENTWTIELPVTVETQ